MDSIKKVINTLNSNSNYNSLNCDTTCACTCNKCHPLEDIMK